MEQQDRDAFDRAPAPAPTDFSREREMLIPLSMLDAWTLSDGEPDIRGWDVHTVSGRPLGTVRDLLVDGQAGEVVSLDIGLADTGRHTFVPMRVVQIERAKQVVVMDSADLPRANAAPAERTVPSRRATDVRAIRYQRADREIAVDRVRLADGVLRRETSAPGIESSESERRRAARRRIDRMSTDF